MSMRKFHHFGFTCKTISKSINWISLETPEALSVLVSKLLNGQEIDRTEGAGYEKLCHGIMFFIFRRDFKLV